MRTTITKTTRTKNKLLFWKRKKGNESYNLIMFLSKLFGGELVLVLSANLKRFSGLLYKEFLFKKNLEYGLFNFYLISKLNLSNLFLISQVCYIFLYAFIKKKLCINYPNNLKIQRPCCSSKTPDLRWLTLLLLVLHLRRNVSDIQ